MLDLGESEIRAALERLGRRRWTRLASWSSGRSMKYRHLLDETLGLDGPQVSLLAVLMLRGPQTPGELRQRTERLHRFGEAELDEAIAALEGRELVRQLPRRPGQREQRYEQLLGEGAASGPVEEAAAPPNAEGAPPADGLPERVAQLERELGSVRDELRALREELGT